MKVVEFILGGRNDLESRFYYCGGLVQVIHVGSCRKDWEGIFHHCEASVKLMYGWLGVKRIQKALLTIVEVLSTSCTSVWILGNIRAPVKLEHSCLWVRIHPESSFHHFGSPVRLMQASLSTWKGSESIFVEVVWSSCTSMSGGIFKAGFTAVEVMWKFCMPVWVPGWTKEAFLPLLRSCEADAHQFEGWDRSWKQFSPLWKFCETRTGQFEYQQWFRKRFLPLWMSYGALVHMFLSQEGPWKQSCESSACLFECQGRTGKQFSPPLRSSEDCSRQFECQEDPECVIYICKGSVKLLKASLRVRKDEVHLWWSCVSCSRQFECQKLFRKQFSPLWRSCKALLHPFISQLSPWKLCLLLWSSYEGCVVMSRKINSGLKAWLQCFYHVFRPDSWLFDMKIQVKPQKVYFIY